MHKTPVDFLLIDDDEINNFLSNELIKLYHPNIAIKSTLYVQDAINELQEKIKNEVALPQIILVDINMPILNGWDFLEAFEKMDADAIKNVRVFIYTSSIYYKDIEKAKKYKSVIKLITKPLSQEMINEIII